MTNEEARDYLIDLIENSQYETEPYDISVAALEKQIPKKPIMWANEKEHCPNENCEKDVSQIGTPNFCPDCGQALDWGQNQKD